MVDTLLTWYSHEKSKKKTILTFIGDLTFLELTLILILASQSGGWTGLGAGAQKNFVYRLFCSSQSARGLDQSGVDRSELDPCNKNFKNG